MNKESDNELFASIALGILARNNPLHILPLIRATGSASVILENRNDLPSLVPEVSPNVSKFFTHVDEAIEIAKREIDFISSKNITPLCYTSSSYPARLRDCEDAPVVLFSMGNANYNTPKIVSVVGTRNMTSYGQDICNSFITQLHSQYPDMLFISGLAYGVDICAHRAALGCGASTVGVLAHGLDRIYPSIHRHEAAQMLGNGGLITEYVSATTPERFQFLQRNRIIAGLADAVVVVESASHGGSMVTAEIAATYHRDVFSFPGRIFDKYSEGCNRLIRAQKAVALQDAADFLDAMNWSRADHNTSKQLELFIDYSEEEQKIIEVLKTSDDSQVNQIVVETGYPFSKVSSTLFSLETKGVVKVLGGGRYRLVRR